MLFKVYLLSATTMPLQCLRSYEEYKGRVRMGSDEKLHFQRRLGFQEQNGYSQKEEDKRRYTGRNSAGKVLR